MTGSWILAFLIIAVVCHAAPHSKNEPQCGYKSCNPVKDDMINVHLVPHTHDDVGWLKTVDQYFYGAKNYIQNAGVQYVLDSVIPELVNDPGKRFIYVEIAFFARWWNEQDDSMRHIVKGLVNNGQLEFILGGWCMNDEASTHYNAIIDQHALGFEFLKLNFGECGRPRIGWQIDPFGHSREQASLFAQFGFDGLFFGRLDYQDKANRLNKTTMEMVWHGSPNNLGGKADLFTGALYNGYGPPGGFSWDQFDSTDPIMVESILMAYPYQHMNHLSAITCEFHSLDCKRLKAFPLGSAVEGKKADLFTGALPNNYNPPPGFCFDQFCNDEPIMDDPRLHDYNVNEKVRDFVKAVNDQAKHYKTNHIVMTMGSDFQYQNAHHWYKNMDKLIKYVNQLQQTNNSRINVLYSTPSCYTYQLNRANKVWTTKSDDFFPYAHREDSFWTGYFTSRAALKGYVRDTNNFLQACKQLDALAMLENIHHSTLNIQVLREAMGVAQHHDAVSGTEKQQVAYDYAERLGNGRDECKKVMNDALGLKLIPKGSQGYPALEFCDLLNISACNLTQNNKQFVMVVYNPLTHPVKHWMRLPVIGNAYTVNGPNNEAIQTQIVPVTKRTKAIPERKGYIATNELVFQVKLPPLGFSTFFIKMSTDKKLARAQASVKIPASPGQDIMMKNKHLALKFDGMTGQMKSWNNLDAGISTDVHQDIAFYYGMAGNCSKGKFQPSGAYIFRPNGSEPVNFTNPSSSSTIMGDLVQETFTQFSEWVTQVTRVYKDTPYTELEWTVGPIPIKDKIGKEVVVRFDTGLNNQKTFYTDANGREILKRVVNYRETWHLNQTEPVAGNYYPVNSRIYIKDEQTGQQFTVLTDRSEGGASIHDGQVELMVHRRLLYDDCLGVGEPMNETGSDGQGLIVRGKMKVLMGDSATAAKMHRDLALQTYMAPIAAFSLTDMKYSEYTQYFHTSYSGLKQALPANVHMLTLEQWGGSIEPAEAMPYLIRLEHIYETGEDPEMSQPATVSLQDLFVPFDIESINELTLGANLPLAELERLQWTTEDDVYVTDTGKNVYKVKEKMPVTGPLDILLKPMEIRTFQVILKKGIPFKTDDKFKIFS